MSKKIHVRPGKGQSKVGFVMGLLFCLIGLFVAIPIFGPFGIIWTAMAGLITFINYRNGFTDKQIDSHVIDIEGDGSDITVTREMGFSMLHMIVEQTYKYPMRMEYQPETGKFCETEYQSLQYVRGFTKPYGWIKESGTPPQPHWDCLLLTDAEYDLGDEIEIKVVGVFKRGDLDHKYVVVEATREIEDISQITTEEKEELARLYPRIREGEGWFGKAEAEYCMKHHEKAL